ncbi:hypothetical protein V2J09_010664 [Rumex salicifolius]
MKDEKIQHHHHYDGDMTDLRQFFTTAPTHNFPPPPPPTTASHQALFSSAFSPLTQHYDVSMMLAMGAHALPGGGGSSSSININAHGFRSNAPTPTITTSGSYDVDAGDGGATARWPRQETLTLLEVRSRLDPKFKEANHKGPLWDELSRIMCEEHGYQRSGKKCREKFENLYKYYKKTRDGKAGRHDGKNYRFFRQLEALYGETSHTTTNSTNHLHTINRGNNITNSMNTIHMATNEGQCNIASNQDGFQSVSLSNYSPSDFDYTSSSEAEKEGSTEHGESSMDVMVRSSRRNKRGVRSWKEKMKEFINSQMRKMMDKQEAWLESMVRTIEQKEKERVCREEEWRRQETQRVERENKFWAEERAWIEARDKALIDVLHGIIASKEVVVMEKNLSYDDHQKQQQSQEEEESELEIAIEKAKANGNKDQYCSKKRKVNWRPKSTNCNIQIGEHFHNNLYKHGEMNNNSQGGMELDPQQKVLGETGNSMNENCLRMLLGDGGTQKLSMGSQLWS